MGSSAGGYLVDSLVESGLCKRTWVQALNPFNDTSDCFSLELAAVSPQAGSKSKGNSPSYFRTKAAIPPPTSPGAPPATVSGGRKPVWGKYKVYVDREVNSLSFSYLHSGSPEGILSLWVDDEMIAEIDLRPIPKAKPQHVVDLLLPRSIAAGQHEIGFRLDSYDDIGARVQVVNVNFGKRVLMEDADSDGIGDELDSCVSTTSDCSNSEASPPTVSGAGTETQSDGVGSGGGVIGVFMLFSLLFFLPGLRRRSVASTSLS